VLVQPSPYVFSGGQSSSDTQHLSPTTIKNLKNKGIVKKQVSDGPRLKPGRFCLMGRQSRSKGREWDRNRTSMGLQWDAKMLREH